MNHTHFGYQLYGTKKNIIKVINLMLLCKGKSLLNESDSLDKIQSAIDDVCQDRDISIRTLLQSAERGELCCCDIPLCWGIDWGDVSEVIDNPPYGPDKNFVFRFSYSGYEGVMDFTSDIFYTFRDLDLVGGYYDEGWSDVFYSYQTQYVEGQRRLYFRVLERREDARDGYNVEDEGFVA